MWVFQELMQMVISRKQRADMTDMQLFSYLIYNIHIIYRQFRHKTFISMLYQHQDSNVRFEGNYYSYIYLLLNSLNIVLKNVIKYFIMAILTFYTHTNKISYNMATGFFSEVSRFL